MYLFVIFIWYDEGTDIIDEKMKDCKGNITYICNKLYEIR